MLPVSRHDIRLPRDHDATDPGGHVVSPPGLARIHDRSRAAPTSAMIYPRIAIDRDPASPRDGTIYVVGLQYAPNGSCGNPAVVRSIDGGRTFDAPHVAPLCLSGLSLDVTADNGTLFAASWGPRLLRSTDGGISWEILATIGNASAPASPPV